MSIPNQLWTDVRDPSVRSRRSSIVFVSVCLLGLALLPAVAQAGVGAGTAVTFPTTATVGQSGLPASVTLENRNTAPNDTVTNTVCNAGEASPPCSSPERGIVLVPACKQVAAGQCTPDGADPGVFRVSPTGTGRAGSACAGMQFGTSLIDPVYGTVRFTPQPAGAQVELAGFGSACVIDFTFAVLKSPTGDQNPSRPGTQTAQATEHAQFDAPLGPGALNNFARSTSNGTTVLRAGPPSITTAASADVTLGGELTDQATVTGLVNPVPGASVTFRLYPPLAHSCTGPPVFSDTQVVVIAGTTATATSDAFTPTVAGVYHWVATYDGDANNMPVSGICGEATETTTVTGPPPTTTPPQQQPPTEPPPPAESGGVLGVCVEAPAPAPAGSVLCQQGSALLSGRTGCQRKAFRVQVRGKQIAKVVFTVDGTKLATLRAPNSGNRFSVMLVPGNLKIGRHRVNARITFAKSTGTRARTLGMVVSRCRRAAVQPRFVG